MDRAKFIEQAPLYYAAAIVTYLDRHGSQVSVNDIAEYYGEWDEDTREKYSFLVEGAIADRAIKWLVENDIIDVVDDHFGPTIFGLSFLSEEARARIVNNKVLAFSNLELVTNKEQWIKRALQNMRRKEIELQITDADFDSANGDWEPIPLERGDPSLQSAILKVDETINQVRGDNGYAATHPEERRSVLSGLTALVSALRNDESVSRRFLHTYGFAPLESLITRFGKAALGIGALAAREAIIMWLKDKGVTILRSLF